MPNTTLIESFLRQMYGDSQGFAILTTITPPIEPDDDPVVIDTPFEYPTQTAEMAAAASESAPGADVYYCTSLRSKSRRRREFSSPVGAVWTTVSTGCPAPSKNSTRTSSAADRRGTGTFMFG